MSIEIGALWREALRDVVCRHPDRRSNAVITVPSEGLPYVHVALDRAFCTVDGKEMKDFAISSVYLTFFPGERLARMWLAAAWAGYLQHEALEMTSWHGSRPLDPHSQPYPTNPFNGGLRDGFPPQLTPRTMYKTLCVVMDPEFAELLMHCEGFDVKGTDDAE